MEAPQIRLETASGATLLARLVAHGAHYGPGDRGVNESLAPLVDFSIPRTSGLMHVGTYLADDVRSCCERRQTFTPGGKLAYRLERDACRRLLSWIDEPYAPDDSFTALVIGDEETCGRTAAMLRHLGLETHMTHDAVQGLARATSQPPSLVLVDADGLTRLTAADLVARLRSSSQARDVPLLVSSANPAAHGGLDADAVLRSPVDEAELTAAVSELFELV